MYQMNHRIVANGTPHNSRFDNVALLAQRAGYSPKLFGYTDQAVDPRDTTGPDDPRLFSYEAVLRGFECLLPMGTPFTKWNEFLRENGVDVSINELDDIAIDRIIEMAWEDRTPFDAIKFQFGLAEADVKALMKKELKFSSYKLWRQRVENCKTKHAAKRAEGIDRFKCKLQRAISNNKISKR
jgi:uncharacterized protein (TIGR03643 family)